MRLLVLILLLTTAAATPAPAQPADGTAHLSIKLLDAPTSRRDDPRARLYIVDHLNPGQTIHRRVQVTNDSGTPRAIELYPAAATIQACVIRRNRRRSTMSARAPAGRITRKTGNVLAAWTNPILRGDIVSWVISQPAPTFCIQVPV